MKKNKYFIRKTHNKIFKKLKSIDIQFNLNLIFQILGDKNSTAGLYNNLGNLYNSLGNYNKSVEYYSRALQINERVIKKPLIFLIIN